MFVIRDRFVNKKADMCLNVYSCVIKCCYYLFCLKMSVVLGPCGQNDRATESAAASVCDRQVSDVQFRKHRHTQVLVDMNTNMHTYLCTEQLPTDTCTHGHAYKQMHACLQHGVLTVPSGCYMADAT